MVMSTKSVKKRTTLAMKKYFHYKIKDNGVVGICILCETKSISKIIKKKKNANTAGLKTIKPFRNPTWR